MTRRPPALGTVVPVVRYQVIDRDTMKWVTVFIGPETPLSCRKAYEAAGLDARLWLHDGDSRRPLF